MKIAQVNIIPKIVTPNIYSTILSYSNVFNEINLKDLKINDNGTIEYEGNVFTEDEVEESSTEKRYKKGLCETSNLAKPINAYQSVEESSTKKIDRISPIYFS